MYFLIGDDSVILMEASNFSEFHISLSSSSYLKEIGKLIHEYGIGEISTDGTHVMVPIEAIREYAGATLRSDSAWNIRLESMLAYADGHNWLSNDGRSVRAHLK